MLSHTSSMVQYCDLETCSKRRMKSLIPKSVLPPETAYIDTVMRWSDNNIYTNSNNK